MMKRALKNRTIITSFGTTLKELNPTVGKFKVTQDFTAHVDTPLQDVAGTTKTFLKDLVVDGNLWLEVNPQKTKKRKVVMVYSDDGRYLIDKSNLKPTTVYELEAEDKIKTLENQVDELLDKATNEVSEIADNPSDFLDRKYAGFTGKQILVGVVGMIVIVKLFK
jgi:hypothetical protein